MDLAGGSPGPLVEPLLQSHRVVAGFVTGGEEQGDGLMGQPIEKGAGRRLGRRPFKFGVIGGLEVFSTLRIAVEAAAQRVARR